MYAVKRSFGGFRRGLGDVCVTAANGLVTCGASPPPTGPAGGPGMSISQLWQLAQTAPGYLTQANVNSLIAAGYLSPKVAYTNTGTTNNYSTAVQQYLKATGGGIAPGRGTPGGWGGGGGGNQQALAAAQQSYATNPSSLTQQQWTLLQQAGVIPNQLPYSAASTLGPSGSTASTGSCPASTPYADGYGNCFTTAAAASASAASLAGSSSLSSISLTDPTTWPWYLWLGVAAGAYLLLKRK